MLERPTNGESYPQQDLTARPRSDRHEHSGAAIRRCALLDSTRLHSSRTLACGCASRPGRALRSGLYASCGGGWPRDRQLPGRFWPTVTLRPAPPDSPRPGSASAGSTTDATSPSSDRAPAGSRRLEVPALGRWAAHQASWGADTRRPEAGIHYRRHSPGGSWSRGGSSRSLLALRNRSANAPVLASGTAVA